MIRALALGLLVLAVADYGGVAVSAELKLNEPKDVLVVAQVAKSNQRTGLVVELNTQRFVPGTTIVVKSAQDGQHIGVIAPFGVGQAPTVTKYQLLVPAEIEAAAGGNRLKLRFELEASERAEEFPKGEMVVKLGNVTARPVDVGE